MRSSCNRCRIKSRASVWNSATISLKISRGEGKNYRCQPETRSVSMAHAFAAGRRHRAPAQLSGCPPKNILQTIGRAHILTATIGARLVFNFPQVFVELVGKLGQRRCNIRAQNPRPSISRPRLICQEARTGTPPRLAKHVCAAAASPGDECCAVATSMFTSRSFCIPNSTWIFLAPGNVLYCRPELVAE